MSYEPHIVRRATARLAAAREGRERRQEALQAGLYQSHPRLRELDRALRGTMADLAEVALSGDPHPEGRIQAIRERNLALQEERRQLLATLNLSPDALDGSPACPRCRDTGWVGHTMCTCLKELCAQEQAKDLSALLDLGDQRFENFRLDYYSSRPWKEGKPSPRQVMERVEKLCRRYAQEFGALDLRNLFFSGGTGLGKTFLSACIARVVTESGHSVVYDSACSVFSAFEDRKFNRDPQARDDTRRYLNCELLILDDLGSEMTTPLVQAALYEVVNTRLVARRHTVISSNLSLPEIALRYSPQVASRLEGEYRVLSFIGEDIRPKKAAMELM